MKKLIQVLNALPGHLMQQAEKAALASADHGAQIARSSVPVDTGELRDSISSAPAAGGAVITAAAPHAAMVEYGTSKMKPRPFMLSAAHAVAREFFDGVGENIK